MAGFDLPPLMLTHHESEALMVAIRLLKTWGGDSLSQALESAQEKVLAILPPESRRRAEQTRIFAPDFGNQPHSRSAFDLIHRAVSAQQVLALHYRDESGNLSGATFSRWDYFSGASTGCWLAGARSVTIIVAFALIDV